MIINKKAIRTIIIIILSLSLTGCWNYVGLNEMTIVTGFAIDKSEDNNFHVTCEMIDLSKAGKEKIIATKLIESYGETLFDAMRNAKRRINNKLYFGNTQIIIISNQIAKEDGLTKIIDWFIRDAEPRETMSVAISQEKTAKEVLSKKGMGTPIISMELKDIIEKDEKITLSTKNNELYKIFNILRAKGKSLVLAAFHQVQNDEILVNEVNGVGVFKNDKLIGYLSPDETKYYLFAINEVKGGVINLNTKINNKKTTISFEIFKSNTNTSYQYKDNKVYVTIKTNTNVSINEDENHKNIYDEKTIKKLSAEVQQLIVSEIKKVVKTVQQKYDSDIFGFGNMIYKTNLKLWNKLSNNWDNIFKDIEVKVDPKVTIINTAYTK